MRAAAFARAERANRRLDSVKFRLKTRSPARGLAPKLLTESGLAKTSEARAAAPRSRTYTRLDLPHPFAADSKLRANRLQAESGNSEFGDFPLSFGESVEVEMRN